MNAREVIAGSFCARHPVSRYVVVHVHADCQAAADEVLGVLAAAGLQVVGRAELTAVVKAATQALGRQT